MSDHNLLNLSINCGLMLRNVNTANCPLADSAVIDFVRVRHGNGGWEEGGGADALRSTFIDKRSKIM